MKNNVTPKDDLKKRILIFSPYVQVLEGIDDIIDRYFRKECPDVYRNTQVEKFMSIKDSIDSGSKIGIIPGQDILVVLDRKMCPKDRRTEPIYRSPNEKIYFHGLEMLIDMSKNICDELGIPCIIYTGEIEKRDESGFIKKLSESLDKVLERYSDLF